MITDKRLLEAREVFDKEIDALEKMRDALDEDFLNILDRVVACEGKVVITGIGKPGHVGEKIASTLSSLGTPSFYLHPAEAQHGDLGMITAKDVVVAISYSGESDELVAIIPNIKLIGAYLIAITANENSTLAKASDLIQLLPRFEEACAMGLAPTSSTTVEMCYGDALAVTASTVYGFNENDFGRFHPAGSLGKKLLLRVDDIMFSGDKNAVIDECSKLKDAIVIISKKQLGMITVVNKKGILRGVITSGDIRCALEKNGEVNDIICKDIMTKEPYVAQSGSMAVDALRKMALHNFSSMPVVKDGKAIGTIRISDILKMGIVDNVDFSVKK